MQDRNTSSPCRPRITDWSRPTNAVPGVPDAPNTAKASRENEESGRFPVLTLLGFGGKTYTISVPDTVRNMPGMGEDYANAQGTSRSRDRDESPCPTPGYV